MNTNPSNGKRHRCRYQLHQRVLDFKEYKYRRSKITEFETLLHSGSRTRRADHRRSSKHQSGAEWRSSTTLPELKAVWGGRGRGGASKHLNIWFRISLDVIRQYNIISINLRISHVDCQWLFLFLLSVEIIEIVSQFFFCGADLELGYYRQKLECSAMEIVYTNTTDDLWAAPREFGAKSSRDITEREYLGVKSMRAFRSCHFFLVFASCFFSPLSLA